MEKKLEAVIIAELVSQLGRLKKRSENTPIEKQDSDGEHIVHAVDFAKNILPLPDTLREHRSTIANLVASQADPNTEDLAAACLFSGNILAQNTSSRQDAPNSLAEETSEMSGQRMSYVIDKINLYSRISICFKNIRNSIPHEIISDMSQMQGFICIRT